MDFIGDVYPETFKNVCDSLAYDHIFILKPWKEIYKSDTVRYESFEQALKIHECLVNTYEGFNYTLIDVPFDTVENRADYILNEIQSL
jgi:predicted ATPase